MAKQSNPVLPPDFKQAKTCSMCPKQVQGFWGTYKNRDGTDAGVCSKECSLKLLAKRVEEENQRSLE
jgi:hypothetical protein